MWLCFSAASSALLPLSTFPTHVSIPPQHCLDETDQLLVYFPSEADVSTVLLKRCEPTHSPPPLPYFSLFGFSALFCFVAAAMKQTKTKEWLGGWYGATRCTAAGDNNTHALSHSLPVCVCVCLCLCLCWTTACWRNCERKDQVEPSSFSGEKLLVQHGRCV